MTRVFRFLSQTAVVAVSVWYHVGSGREKPGRTGFAHLFEHLMFEGARRAGPRADGRRRLAPHVPGGGDRAPAHGLLTSFLQRRDDPADIAGVAFPRLLYGEGHRYGTPEAGSTASVTALTGEDLRAFYAGTYRPDRAEVLVVGDVTPASVMPPLERAFGAWTAGGPAPARAVLPEARQRAARRRTLVLVVGDRAKVEAPLRAPTLGPLTIRTVEATVDSSDPARGCTHRRTRSRPDKRLPGARVRGRSRARSGLISARIPLARPLRCSGA